MDFLSKLMRGADKAAKEFLKDLTSPVPNGSSANAAQAPAPKAAKAESGFSWGPYMPAEENQYNYPGSWREYFTHVFCEDFPGYVIRYDDVPRRNAGVFTFELGGRTELVVELLSETSSLNRLRDTCRREGIPYLRFYYNHDGWWNTRSYVVSRVRAALRV